MGTYNYAGTSDVTGDDIKNTIANMRRVSPEFDAVFRYIGQKNINIAVEVTNGGSAAATFLGPDLAHPGMDLIISIPQQLFDGDTYDVLGGGTAKITLERLLSHEFFHGFQWLDPAYANDPPEDLEEAAPWEHEATKFSDEVAKRYGEPPQGKYYNDPEDPLSGETTNSGSGDDPADNIHDATSDSLPENPVPVEADKPSWLEIVWDAILDALGAGSPLVLDLDGTSGIQLSSSASSGAVYWDIDNDGFREASGWVSGGDGFLAIDLNEDGVINNNSELFGNSAVYANGFAALDVYDTNNDNQITSTDAQFGDLLVWIDDNHDGYSEEDELYTLNDLSITSISTAWTDTNTSNNGNTIKQTSTFVQSGNTKTIVDVWFAYDDINTVYNEDYILDYQALFLPMMRGFGELPDLYISASIDNTGSGNLLGLLQDFSDKTFSQVFDGTTDLIEEVREILYRWADIESVPSNSRGDFVDGQELEFLEKLMGQDYYQGGYAPNPVGPGAGNLLNEAFHIALNNIYARLVAQTDAGELFEGDWSYNPTTDAFTGITGLVQAKLDALETEAAGLANTAAREIFWSNVLRMIEYSVGVSNLPGGDQTALNTAIEDSDSALDLGDLLNDLEFSVAGGTTNNGTSGNDTITGGSGNDMLSGQAGTDTISGGSGHDTIQGGNDADSLTGGTGGDYLIGGSGNDLYYYNIGDGSDTIKDTGSGSDAEEIVFGSGISAGNLTFSRLGNTTLFIEIGNGVTAGQIVIENQFYHSGGVAYERIETIRFSGGSTISLAGQTYTTYGSSGNDSISGLISLVGSITDTIYAYGGDDTISAGTGNDTVYGGDGTDTIYGEDDNDTLYGDAGADTLIGGYGNDSLYGGTGGDTVQGNAGDDLYYYGGGDDTFAEGNAAAGADEIRFASGVSSGDLTYARVNGGLDLLITVAGTGNGSILVKDQFYSSGAYINETIRFSGGSTIALTSLSYTSYGTDANNGINGVTSGGATNDTIYLYGGADTSYAGNGNDTVYGGDGNDTIYGDNDNDALYGDGGNDSLYGEYGNDLLSGGAGDDFLRDISGDDVYVYSGGIDTIYDSSGTTGDILRLSNSATINDITVANYSSSDTKITVASGTDEIIIQYQRYSYYYEIDRIEFSDGFSTTLTDYASWISGTGSGDTLNGTSGHNTLIGKDGNDTLSGAAGADDLHGGAGTDTLYGGDDADLLHGGDGNDILYGQSAADVLWGGAGADTFMFQTVNAFGGVDTIKDFSTADGDIIDISDILSSYDPLTHLLTDWVEITTSGADSVVKVDRDGTGGTYSLTQIATIQGVTGLTDEAALVTNGNLLV